MAKPKCPKCDHAIFQASLIEPSGSKFKVQAIHCAKCGCVVGTQEYYNVGVLVTELAKKLGHSIT